MFPTTTPPGTDQGQCWAYGTSTSSSLSLLTSDACPSWVNRARMLAPGQSGQGSPQLSPPATCGGGMYFSSFTWDRGKRMDRAPSSDRKREVYCLGASSIPLHHHTQAFCQTQSTLLLASLGCATVTPPCSHRIRNTQHVEKALSQTAERAHRKRCMSGASSPSFASSAAHLGMGLCSRARASGTAYGMQGGRAVSQAPFCWGGGCQDFP